MRDFGLLIAAASCGYLGFAMLALSQKQHWRAVTGAAASSAVDARSGLRRAVGLTLLLMCLALAWLRSGATFGALLFVFLLGVTGLAVAFTLAWRPSALRRIILFGGAPEDRARQP